MSDNNRTSTRNVRPPTRYGDSVLSQKKRNGSKNNGKKNNQEQKKDESGNVNGDGKVSEEIRNKGKECIFDGDLNGESFPVLQSQVNKSKPTNVTPNCDVTENSVVNDVVVGDNVNETTMNNNTGSVNLDNESACNSKNVHSNEVSCDGISSDCGNVASTFVENAKVAVNDTNKKNSSLVDIVKKATLDNKLLVIPTEIAEDGHEVAVFDEETVELGSVKWNRTVCGQFLGCSMSFNEARYHLRRMWYKYGPEEVTVNDRGVFFFKFSDEQGILNVISNGPWMVNNKPMFVQRWSIDVCLDRSEPKKLPVWVKLLNIPLEAWSVKGISTLASCLGKPLIMDDVTTQMCLTGVGRLGYARVLVELDASKELKNVVEIVYKKKDAGIVMKKLVEVEYAWKPYRCEHCCVFGHDKENCRLIIRDDKEKQNEQEKNDDGFNEVKNKQVRKVGNDNRKNSYGQNKYANASNKFFGNTSKGNASRQANNKFEYKRINEKRNHEDKTNDKGKEKVVDVGNDSSSKLDNSKERSQQTATKLTENPKDKNKGKDTGLGSNRFTLLSSLVDENELVPDINERKIVDGFISNKMVPTETEVMKWNDHMKRYYKDRMELIDAANDMESEDVIEELDENEQSVLRNEVDGTKGDTFV